MSCFVIFDPFTERYAEKLHVWGRLSAFASGQQAKICLGGECSVKNAESSDCCGCRSGKRSHNRLFGKQQGRGLQGEVVLLLNFST